MKYLLIKGHFHVVGHSPDGDSIKFIAENPSTWDLLISDYSDTLKEKLAEVDPKTSVGNVVTVRLQGVDALETHYTPRSPRKPDDITISDDRGRPSPGRHHQPGDIGRQAADFLLEALHVLDVTWYGTRVVKDILVKSGRRAVRIADKFEDALPGYIITRYIDPKGRPIAWVFGGKTSARNGALYTAAQVARKIARSANYKLLREGLVYPYFYMTLPSSIRDLLVEAVVKARGEADPFMRSKRKLRSELKRIQVNAADQRREIPRKIPNVWVYDRTTRGIALSELVQITEETEMWPYLFRKLIKHWHRTNTERYWDAIRAKRPYKSEGESKLDLDGFFKTGNPYVFIISDREFKPLDEVLVFQGERMKLKKMPYDLVFLS